MKTENGRYEIEKEYKRVVKFASYTRMRDVEEGSLEFGSINWARDGQEESGPAGMVVDVAKYGTVPAEGRYMGRVKESEDGTVLDYWDEGEYATFATEAEAVAWVESKLGIVAVS